MSEVIITENENEREMKYAMNAYEAIKFFLKSKGEQFNASKCFKTNNGYDYTFRKNGNEYTICACGV